MSNTYKNIVFTKHALERMSKRSIGKNRIWRTINHPDKTLIPKGTGNKDTSKKYLRTIGNRKYQAVATYLSKERKYLVISTWVRGEDDRQSIIWIIITLPFKMLWWVVKKLTQKLR